MPDYPRSLSAVLYCVKHFSIEVEVLILYSPVRIVRGGIVRCELIPFLEAGRAEPLVEDRDIVADAEVQFSAVVADVTASVGYHFVCVNFDNLEALVVFVDSRHC